MIELKVLRKQFYEEVGYPGYATQGSAAIDLISTGDFIIAPQEVKMIPTGLAMHIGSGYANVAAIVLPRSGLGHNKGIILGNSVGLIDEDYQGELTVSIWNRNERPYDYRYTSHVVIRKGERFAQLLFVPIIKPEFSIVEEFSQKTERGDGGWGSTNVN